MLGGTFEMLGGAFGTPEHQPGSWIESDERAARVAQERGAKIAAQPLSPRHGRRAVPMPRKPAQTFDAPSAAEFNNMLRSRVEKGACAREPPL